MAKTSSAKFGIQHSDSVKYKPQHSMIHQNKQLQSFHMEADPHEYV